MNGIIAPLQAAYIHCLLHDIKAPNLFRTIFFLQAWFLWVSPMIIILLNISRLIAILNPFYYINIVTHRTTAILLCMFWLTGLVECFIKRYAYGFSQLSGYYMYKYFVSNVLLHLILNVIVLGLAMFTLLQLKTSDRETQCESRVKATKTVILVSTAFFFTYGYYIYVYIVWMIPDLAKNTTNPWLKFTAIGKWSLSLGHLFLLVNSLFNGVIFGLQPNIRCAIENIWVPNYHRITLQQKVQSTASSQLKT